MLINNIITTFKYVSYIFVAVGILTVVLCLLVLYFDIAIPNELKGFIFFAQVMKTKFSMTTRVSLPHTHTQVVGIVYQNSPYLNKNEGSGVSPCTDNIDSFGHMFFLYLFYFRISF